MDPLLAPGSVAAAALDTVKAHRIAMTFPAEWTEAMAGTAAPKPTHAAAPAATARPNRVSAPEQADGTTRELSVADAVTIVTTQLTGVTAAAANPGSGPAASTETAEPAEPAEPDDAASDTSASSSLGATGRASAKAALPHAETLSKTTADTAPRAGLLPQAAQTWDRVADTIEKDPGGKPQESPKPAAPSRPAGTSARRAVTARAQQSAAAHVSVSSPAAAATILVVSTAQPPQTPARMPNGSPALPTTAATSAPGGGSAGAPQNRTSDAATGGNASYPRGQTALAGGGDPVATKAMAQPSEGPGSTPRRPSIDKPAPAASAAPKLDPAYADGPSRAGSPAAQATTDQSLANSAATSPVLSVTAHAAGRGGETAPTADATTRAVRSLYPVRGTPAQVEPAIARVTAQATTTGTIRPAASAQATTTDAIRPAATALATATDIVRPAISVRASSAASTAASPPPPSPPPPTIAASAAQPIASVKSSSPIAAAVTPGSPTETPPDAPQGEGHGTGSPATVATAIVAGGAGTTVTIPSASSPGAPVAPPSAALPLAVAADGAPAARAAATDRVGDVALRPGGPARSAPSAGAVATPSPGSRITAVPSTPVTMPATQGGASWVGTPTSASGLIAGSLGTGSPITASLSPGTGSMATAGAGVSPTTIPAPVVTPLGYTPATPDAMAASIVAMYRSGQSSLVLRLDPPGLGTVSVHLALGGNAVVNVLFVPAVAQTSHLLQSGLGDLRQAMAASGLTLGQAQIGGGASGGAGGGASAGNPGTQPGASSRIAVAVATPSEPAPPENAARGARAIA
jgi:flagellar hook-length control protein FliK